MSQPPTPAPRTIAGLPARLAAYIGVVVAAAVPLLVLAVTRIAAEPTRASTVLALALFFALSLFTELRPVPMDADAKSEVTLTNVFTVAVAVIFGWEYAVPLAGMCVGTAMLINRRGAARTLFNVAMYSLAAAAAVLPALALGHVGVSRPLLLTAEVLGGGALNTFANVVVVSGAIALSEKVPYRSVALHQLRQGGASFAIMSFLSAVAANLWLLNPWLIGLLTGPLLTLTLYQRSALHSRIAMRDAHTDNLTGLGNHRAYQAALRDAAAQAHDSGEPFSLCLLDVDDFKLINDTYGHPIGDDLLVRLAELLAAVPQGTAFRFGGDEFAVLIASDELSAYREIERLQDRLAQLDIPLELSVTISAGIATYPTHADDVEELQRTSDGALLWAKAHGKNRSCLFSQTLTRVRTPRELEQEAERGARLRAAKNLVRFVDARDPSTATHSQVVSELAGALGLELGLDPETVEHLRLAGLLHDIGKIGLPDSILRAPRPLTAHEYEMVKNHPEFGYSLLDGLEIQPVDNWVLHHHENWDGTGYPHRLAGEDIALGARIIHVADAFEAITADRPYRRGQSQEVALAELHVHMGTQFDPVVVAALERYLTGAAELAEALA